MSLFLTAAQIDGAARERLLAGVVDYQAGFADITRIGREKGLSPEQTAKLRNELTTDFQGTVKDLLGAEQGAVFLEFYGAARFASIAEDFAHRCELVGAPLPPAATVAVAVSLSKNLIDPQFPRQSVLLPNGVSVEEDQAVRDLTRVLTPQQVVLFKKLWSERPYPKS